MTTKSIPFSRIKNYRSGRRSHRSLPHCLAFLAVCFCATAHAQPSSIAKPQLQGETVGHVQMGMAFFSRTGTLARETAARGFAPSGGGTLRLGFVHYLARAPWLGFGAGVRGTFGNSGQGDREYFFNPIFTSATAAIRVPVGPRRSYLNVAIDVGFTNILAKTKTLSNDGASIFHEYGIGPGFGLLAGYALYVPPLGCALTLSAQHSRHRVNVEVDKSGSKSWALGVTSILGGVQW